MMLTPAELARHNRGVTFHIDYSRGVFDAYSYRETTATWEGGLVRLWSRHVEQIKGLVPRMTWHLFCEGWYESLDEWADHFRSFQNMDKWHEGPHGSSATLDKKHGKAYA